MSKSNIPQPPAEVSIDELTPEVVALLERASERAEAEEAKHPELRRGWSKEGKLSAALAVEGVERGLLTPALQDHAYAHRHFRGMRCSPAHKARDLWAVLGCGVEAMRPAKDWPVRKMLAPLIERATGYRIRDVDAFADQVARDVNGLAIALAVSPRRRTKVQKSLVGTYLVTAGRLKVTGYLSPVPAREPTKT